MRNWRSIQVLAVFILAASLVLGCGGVEFDDETGSLEQQARTVCGEKTVLPLYAHDGTKVGKVVVRNNNKKVIVKYKTRGNWVIWRTKYHFANKAKNIPQTKAGWLKHWKFKKKAWHKGQPKKFVDKFKRRKGWKDGKEVHFAAFARVAKLNKKGWPVKIVGAWAGKAGWKGNIFNHTMTDCYKDVKLPKGQITMCTKANGPSSKWLFTLKGVPDGYDVWDGKWNGWCVEKVVYMKSGVCYKSTLVSSQDTKNLPDRAKNVNWQLVNYVLNNKHPKASINDMQYAIWYLLGYITKMPTDKETKAMILDAQKNGKDFRPQVGDTVAVIWLSAKGVQLVFLEVQP